MARILDITGAYNVTPPEAAAWEINGDIQPTETMNGAGHILWMAEVFHPGIIAEIGGEEQLHVRIATFYCP